MDYHLQIAEIIPLTEEEKEKKQKNTNYFPDREYVGNIMDNKRRAVLDVVLTSEQWEKIKLAVLEVKS